MIEFSVEAVVNAKASDVYSDWLSSKGHGSFTGGEANIEPVIGFQHNAWDGYIWGKILELTEGTRILMSWKTSDFAEDSKASLVEVLFSDTKEGCRIRINHSQIPENQNSDYETGWLEHYFQPMMEFYKSK